MWSLRRTNVQPIGLDLGYDSIKLLQLEVRPASEKDPHKCSLSVVAAARETLSDQARQHPARRIELAGSQIQRMLAQQPFVGRKVIAALPREVVHVRVLRLPPVPLDELEAVLHSESRDAFAFDVKDARVDFLPAGEVRHGTESRQEVIALAVKKTDIDSCLKQLNACGLTVASLEAELSGLYRAFSRLDHCVVGESDLQMVIDVGARRTQVTIGRGSKVCFYKPVEIGGLHLLDSISRKLTVTVDEARALRVRLLDNEVSLELSTGRREPVRQAVFDACRSIAEELGQELAMCLRYYRVTFRGHLPIKVRLTGGESADPQLQAILQESLGLPVEVASPLTGVDISRMRTADRRAQMAAWALATGLGLKMVNPIDPDRVSSQNVVHTSSGKVDTARTV